jgi:hypothetical protein
MMAPQPGPSSPLFATELPRTRQSQVEFAGGPKPHLQIRRTINPTRRLGAPHGSVRREVRSTKSEIRNKSKGTKRRKSETGDNRCLQPLRSQPAALARPRYRLGEPSSTSARQGSFRPQRPWGAPAAGGSVSAARRNQAPSSMPHAPCPMLHAPCSVCCASSHRWLAARPTASGQRTRTACCVRPQPSLSVCCLRIVQHVRQPAQITPMALNN